jgi:hypothetical protein
MCCENKYYTTVAVVELVAEEDKHSTTITVVGLIH